MTILEYPILFLTLYNKAPPQRWLLLPPAQLHADTFTYNIGDTHTHYITHIDNPEKIHCSTIHTHSASHKTIGGVAVAPRNKTSSAAH